MRGVFDSNLAAAAAVTATGTNGARGAERFSDKWQGVYGHSIENAGVVGESPGMHGVYGVTHGVQSAGVYGTNSTGDPRGAGVLGDNPGGDGVVGRGWRGGSPKAPATSACTLLPAQPHSSPQESTQ